MEFHPKKCQVLHVTNKRNIIKASWHAWGMYLGVNMVNIHHKLSWNHHIQKVISKANSTPAFLQRNNHQCPHETKVLCYQTLLRPVIKYASIIWDPHTNANINILEMVQRRYARFVFHDYRRPSNVIAMLDQLHWASLQERRAQAKVEMMFRICERSGWYSYIIPNYNSDDAWTLSEKYLVPFARTVIYQHSFFPMVLGSGMLCHSSLLTAPPWTASEGRCTVRCSPSSSANCRLRFNT